MSRGELLEMLIAQTEENGKLKQELEEVRAALRDKQIAIENAGSIAEASIQLNGVLEAAQAAAEQYLENLRQRCSQQDSIVQTIQAEAEKKAAAIIAEAEEKAEAITAQANAHCQKTREEADAYWQQISERTQALFQEHDNLWELIQRGRNHHS